MRQGQEHGHYETGPLKPEDSPEDDVSKVSLETTSYPTNIRNEQVKGSPASPSSGMAVPWKPELIGEAIMELLSDSKEDTSTLKGGARMVVLTCQESVGHDYQGNRQTLGNSQGA